MTRYAEEVEPQIFISKLFEIGAALHTEVTKSVLTYNVHCTFATGRGFAATPATSSSYVSNLKLRKNNCSSRIHQYLQLTLLVDNYSFPIVMNHSTVYSAIFYWIRPQVRIRPLPHLKGQHLFPNTPARSDHVFRRPPKRPQLWFKPALIWRHILEQLWAFQIHQWLGNRLPAIHFTVRCLSRPTRITHVQG